MMKNNSLMQYANYLIILSVCIDQGDGRWKERDKENLRHDIMAYKKMAEKLEHEVEAFYEEYPDEWHSSDTIDRIHFKYLANLLNRNTETTKKSGNKDEEKRNFPIVTGGANVHKEISEEKSNNLNAPSQHFIKVNEANSEFNKNLGWPTFEDIILSIGRKYDWKNDRWIKVREKPKKVNYNNHVIEAKYDKIDFHEKHKFSYRIVKLNRSKSRRNVVVAVSAVR